MLVWSSASTVQSPPSIWDPRWGQKHQWISGPFWTPMQYVMLLPKRVSIDSLAAGLIRLMTQHNKLTLLQVGWLMYVMFQRAYKHTRRSNFANIVPSLKKQDFRIEMWNFGVKRMTILIFFIYLFVYFSFALHRRVHSTVYSVLSECLWKNFTGDSGGIRTHVILFTSAHVWTNMYRY